MSDQPTYPAPVLEPAAPEFAAATANPPYLFDLGPADGRKAVDEAQSGDITKPGVSEEWVTIPSLHGDVRARIVTPPGLTGTLPGDRLYPRRRLGLRQRPHPRPARPRTRRQRWRSRGVPRIRPLSGSPLPGSHRAELRHRAVDHLQRRRPWPRRQPARRSG